MSQKPSKLAAFIGIMTVTVALILIIVVVSQVDDNVCMLGCQDERDAQDVEWADNHCRVNGYINSTGNHEDLVSESDDDWIFGEWREYTYCVDENEELSDLIQYRGGKKVFLPIIIIGTLGPAFYFLVKAWREEPDAD